MTPIGIRPATVADLPFLWDMLFESVFITGEERATWRRDPQPPPELLRYLDAWGRPGDAGVVAQDAGGVRLGAAWYRLFVTSDRGNGILAHPNVPELAMAVEREHRGRGIGGHLLAALARTVKDDGYEHASRLHARRHRGSSARHVRDHAAGSVTRVAGLHASQRVAV